MPRGTNTSICSRQASSTRPRWCARRCKTRFRRLVSVLYNAVPRWLFGVETYDAGAVKLVRAEIIRHLPVISRSPFTEAERLIRAARAGYRITAVPVETRPRETGVATGAKLGVLAAAAWDVPRVWLDVMRSPKRPPREPRV